MNAKKMARHYLQVHNETAQRQMSRLRLLGDAVGKVPVEVPEANKEGG